MPVDQSKLKLSIRASPAVEVAAVLAVLNLQTKFNVARTTLRTPTARLIRQRGVEDNKPIGSRRQNL